MSDILIDRLNKRLNDEANNFALELLMPKESFDDFVNEESCCVDDVAEKFQVTAKIVIIRAKQLGYKFEE